MKPHPSTPRVLLDVTPALRNPTTGIGRAVAMLVDHLVCREYRFQFTLFSRRLLGTGWPPVNGPRCWTFHLRVPSCLEPIVRRLNVLERSAPADLYHATDFYLPLPRGHNAVATLYDVLFLSRPETTLDHQRLARWTPRFARQCKRVLTISEFSKREIIRCLGLHPDRVSVIRLGVDSSVFHASVNRTDSRQFLRHKHGLTRPFFLAVSCGFGRKNTPWLLRTFTEWAKTNRSHDLVLVWDPPRRVKQEFSAQVEAGRIHFLPRQSDADLAQLYQSADALLFPSEAEGFGLPIIEALSCGTPVVCHTDPSLDEAAGEAAVRVPTHKGETGEWMQILEAFASGRLDMRNRQALGQAHARQFRWEHWARHTADAYAEALGLSSPRALEHAR